MQKYLQSCARIEEMVGEIYRVLAASPQISWDFRTVLEKLAQDEDQHAQKLRLALRLVREEILTALTVPAERIDALLQEVRGLLETVKARQVTEEQAIGLAVRLEREFCQVHIDSVAEFSDLKMRDMFRALARDDEEHMQVLQHYLDSRATSAAGTGE